MQVCDNFNNARYENLFYKTWADKRNQRGQIRGENGRAPSGGCKRRAS